MSAYEVTVVVTYGRVTISLFVSVPFRMKNGTGMYVINGSFWNVNLVDLGRQVHKAMASTGLYDSDAIEYRLHRGWSGAKVSSAKNAEIIRDAIVAEFPGAQVDFSTWSGKWATGRLPEGEKL